MTRCEAVIASSYLSLKRYVSGKPITREEREEHEVFDNIRSV